MRLLPYLLMLLILATACTQETGNTSESQDESGIPVIAAVNYPLAYFAGRIAQEKVQVYFPDLKGDPAFWQPDAEVVSEFQQADLILLNGAGYAKWVDKVSLPTSKMVNTSKGFAGKYLKVEGKVTHSHGPGGEHAHGGYAFTTWLDLQNALQQAKAILEALSRLMPEHRDYFQANFELLSNDLLSIHQGLKAWSQNWQGKTLYASHPVYQYLAHAQKLSILSEHWEPGEAIPEKQWTTFAFNFAKKPGRLMLWEGAPQPEVKEKLSKMGVISVVFDPGGNKPAQGDWLSLMQANISRLEEVPTDQEK